MHASPTPPLREKSPEISGPRLIWKLIAGFRLRYLWAAAALLVATTAQFFIPLVGSATIDFALLETATPQPANPLLEAVAWIMGGPDTIAENLWRPAVFMLLFALVAGIATYLQKRAAAQASDGICKRLKDHLYDHIQRLPNPYLDQSQTGDLVQRCTSDIETARIFLANHIVEVGRGVILVVAVLPIMLHLHVGLTLVSVSLIPILVAYGYFYVKQVKHRFKEVDEAEGRLTAVVQENITGIRVVRAFGRHPYEIEKFAKPNADYRDSSIRLLRIMAWFWSISDLISLLQIGAALAVGSYLALQGAVSIGTVFAFLALLNIVLWPVRMIGRILTDFGKTTVALKRINEILLQPVETADDAPTAHPETPSLGAIELRSVSFAHNPDIPTLQEIDLSVKPGETLAILGPSGAGKTTLMHLLLRFQDADSGEILLDGIDIKSLDRSYLRAQFGVVLQEPFLYSRSIRSNIEFGAARFDDAAIENAARMASIHETIQSFAHGYDTQIGEKGITLSGGQRQRLALSRALLSDPPILLLDDALSAVDSETESSIIDALRTRHGKRTTIVIAHRLSTLAHADKIIVLEQGRVTQNGSHAALVTQPGLYRRLWQIQTQLETTLAQETQADRQP